MEKSTLEEHARMSLDYYNKKDDMRRELIYLISKLLKEHGGNLHFHTEDEYSEEDLTMVLSMDEFGYESHTYVVDYLELDNMDRVNVRLVRYNYTGFGRVQHITPWYLSLDDLIRIYHEMTYLIEEEMYEEEKHEEE